MSLKNQAIQALARLSSHFPMNITTFVIPRKRAAAWRTRLKRELAKLPEGLNDAGKLILRELDV